MFRCLKMHLAKFWASLAVPGSARTSTSRWGLPRELGFGIGLWTSVVAL